MSLLRRNRAPVAPPQNRGGQSAKRTLLIWIALIFGAVATYSWTSVPAPEPEPRTSEQPPSPGPLMLLPIAVAAALALTLRALRLPAATASPVLTDAPMKEPPPVAVPAAQTPLKLLGRSDFAETSLTLDADGVRWERAARIHSAAQTLFVPWADVEALQFLTAAPRRTWAAVAVLLGLAVASTHLDVALPALALTIVTAVVLWRSGGRATSATVYLVTRTHHLRLSGGAALAEAQGQALAFLYAQRPELRPSATLSLSAFYVRELRALFNPEAALRSELSGGPLAPAGLAYSVRLRRALALWNTGWLVWEPAAIGLAFALPLIPSASAMPVFFVAGGVSSAVGLFACGKALRVLSWLTNMPVVPPPEPKQKS